MIVDTVIIPATLIYCGLGCFLTILMNFLSVAGNSLRYLPDDGSDTTVLCTSNLQLFAQSLMGPVTALKRPLQPDLVKSTMHFLLSS